MSDQQKREDDREMVSLPEDELQKLYGTLSDATTAASTGDTNQCASLAADAKQHVLNLHKEYSNE